MGRNLAYHRHLGGSLEAFSDCGFLLMILDALFGWLSFMSVKLWFYNEAFSLVMQMVIRKSAETWTLKMQSIGCLLRCGRENTNNEAEPFCWKSK